jgi:hypothetical protein
LINFVEKFSFGIVFGNCMLRQKKRMHPTWGLVDGSEQEEELGIVGQRDVGMQRESFKALFRGTPGQYIITQGNTFLKLCNTPSD